jgi:nitrite reductase/ring-hydroxylating ferredoxin subunit/uncharacterized membrane protein
MDGTEVVDIVDEFDWVEPAADALSDAVKTTIEKTGGFSAPLENFLRGTWLGHPLHPVLTDIPIGAWTVAAVFDTAEILGCKGTEAAADGAVAIGLVGAAASAITGLTDWYILRPGSKARKIGTLHALLNITGTVFYGGSLILRKSKKRGFARVLSAIGYTLVGSSAFLGGLLVFGQKIGVDHAPREGFSDGWVSVLPEIELVEGKPQCSKAGEIEIVIVKSHGKIFALANSCSHMGGPLCEGEAKDGSITCPWHGSKFDMATGKVMGSPATFRQPAFDVRVIEGRVEVKASS